MMRIKKCILLSIIMCFMCCIAGCGTADKGDLSFLQGVEDYNEGDYTSAIIKLEEANEAGLNRYKIGDLYTYLGHCYAEMDMPENAIEYYTLAMEEDSTRVEYVVNLAIVYRQSGDNQKAMELYEQALEINPDYPELNSSLGSLYIIENEPEKAIEYFNKAIELDPSLAVAYGNGAFAYAMIGDFEMADEYLEQAVLRGYANADVIRERIDALRE